MTGATEEAPAALAQQLHAVLRVTAEVARIGDDEFDLLLLEPLRQLLPVALVKAGANRRVSIDEFGQGFGHQKLRGVGAAAEMQLAAGQAVVLQQFVIQCLAAGQQASGMLKHQLALAGEAKLAAAALDQLASQVTLQRLDTAAEGGLAEVDGFSRADKTAVIGQCREMAKLA
ncbi:hypothetical protein D3C76_1018790 [compost metagenome]